MQKKLRTRKFWLLFLLIPVIGFSQTKVVLTGKIIDTDTNEPLSFVNVIYLKKSLGTFSDDQGYFSLGLQNVNTKDTILISHIGYTSKRFTIAQLMEKNTIRLTSESNQLQQVTLKSKVEKFKVKSFVKRFVKEYNEHRKNTPHIAVAHYQENAKMDDEYIMFAESAGYSVFAGKIPNAAVYSNYKFFFDQSRAFLSHPKWLEVQEKEFNDVPPSAGSNLRALRVIEHEGILSKKHFNKYAFTLDSTYIDENKQVVKRIGFSGRGEDGFVDVVFENFQLRKIEMKTNDLFSYLQNKEVKGEVRLEFRYYDTTPYISAISSVHSYEGLTHSVSLKILVQKFKDFSFSLEDYWFLNRYNQDPYITFSQEKWEAFGIQKGKSYQEIVDGFYKQNIQLEKEILKHTDVWFRKASSIYSSVTQAKIESLKSNF